MTKDQDQKIIDTADEWNQLRDNERKRFHARFMQGAKILLIFGAIFGTLIISCPYLSDSFNRWRDRAMVENAAETAQAARNDAYLEAERKALEAGKVNRLAEREVAWEECILKLGLGSCTAIEERALQTCFVVEDPNTIYYCVKNRLGKP